MKISEEEFILNLRYFNKKTCLPLKKGNNLILSNSFQEFTTDNIVLFNLNVINENQASIRTFDYFPLIIKFRDNDSSFVLTNKGIEKVLIIKKQSFIFFNSLLKIQIFPLFINHYNIGDEFFFFEKFRKEEGNNLNLNENDEKSKNIIFDLESKKDFTKMSQDKLNLDINIDEEKFHHFNNQDIVNYNKESIHCKEKDNDFEDSSVDKNKLENKNLSFNKKDNSDENISDKPHNSNSMTPIFENLRINFENELPGLIESRTEKTNILKSKIKDDFTQKQTYYKSAHDLQINNLLPRKLIIIEDENESNEIFEPIKISSEENIHVSTTPPRNTRSYTKSVSNNKKELLQKKRKRQGRYSEMNENTDKENSNKKNNLKNHLIINNSRDSNLTVNDNVNISPKHYEKEKIFIELGNSNKTIFPHNLNVFYCPQSEKANTLKQKCTICLDLLSNISRLDNCEHEFCKDCIDQWAILSNECPLCKVEFKKIISWESDNKQITKVKKKKFKFEDEEEEAWVRNSAEKCMVCNRKNDEHLLLVCDRCSFNICHTYCAGLDIIPADDWLCSDCSNTEGLNKETSSSLRRISCNFEDTSNKYIKRRTLIVDDDDEEISKKNNSIQSNSIIKNSNNLNIPFSYKLTQDEGNRNSLHLNLNLNLNISNDKYDRRPKKRKLVRRSLFGIKPHKFRSRHVNQNENILTRRKYNLRKKK